MTYYSVLHKPPLAMMSLLFPMNGIQIRGHLVKVGIVQILVLGMSTGSGPMGIIIMVLSTRTWLFYPPHRGQLPWLAFPWASLGLQTNRHRA